MDVEIRSITEAELDRYIDAVRLGFGGERAEGEEDRIREIIGLDRSHAAFDGKRIVGTIGAYGLQLAVPGGADVKAAGVTRVAVAATHRRRGILSRLMEVHQADARENGESVSCLWASEMPIYGRFGYGLASANVDVEIDVPNAGLTEPADPDRLEMIELDEARTVLPPLHEQIRRQRAGLFARSEAWWTHRTLADKEFMRDGATANRYVVARRDGQPVGYVIYRQKAAWSDDAIPEGRTIVVELLAVDPAAEHTLWSYLATIDLFPTVSAWAQPTDGLVPHLVTNPRAVRRKTNDGLFVHLIDLPTALTARRYSGGGELTIGVTGPQVDGERDPRTFRLSVDDEGVAGCEPTGAPAELTIDAAALGALYLGWVDHGALAGLQLKGQLIGPADSIDRMGRLFGWPIAPWCNEEF